MTEAAAAELLAGGVGVGREAEQTHRVDSGLALSLAGNVCMGRLLSDPHHGACRRGNDKAKCGSAARSSTDCSGYPEVSGLVQELSTLEKTSWQEREGRRSGAGGVLLVIGPFLQLASRIQMHERQPGWLT